MISSIAYGAKSAASKLERMEIEREEPKDNEIQIQVLYAGVCHSDIHQVKNEWKNTLYPCIPGHEVVGKVTKTARGGRFKEGDIVGVGCMIDSCRQCAPCQCGDQNYCEGHNGWLATYNGPMVPAGMTDDGVNSYGRDNTYGGYSDTLVVAEDFVLSIPDKLDIKAAAPILCAGVTVYSPMKHWGVKAGDKVGVLGLGGLGHMAVKIARAMGAEVTEAAFMTTDKTSLASLTSSFDFILSTVPDKHEVTSMLKLLKRDKMLVIVGNLDVVDGVDNSQMAFHRQGIAGSLIGNLADTQEILDFCAEHGIAPDIELIDIADVNEAYTKIENGESRFRCVIDMSSLS